MAYLNLKNTHTYWSYGGQGVGRLVVQSCDFLQPHGANKTHGRDGGSCVQRSSPRFICFGSDPVYPLYRTVPFAYPHFDERFPGRFCRLNSETTEVCSLSPFVDFAVFMVYS